MLQETAQSEHDRVLPPEGISSAPPFSSPIRWELADTLIVFMLGAGAMLASLYGASHIPAAIVRTQSYDMWFEADTPRVYNDMANRAENHYRSNVHPLFVLLTNPVINFFNGVLRIDNLIAIRIVISQVAALWMVTLYALFRLIGCQRLDAVLFCLLAGVSASAIFWFVVPETYAFGSCTILLALLIAGLSQHRKISEARFVLMSAATLSITLTNWMAGIIATFCSLPWRRAVQITVNAFCLVVVLWTAQKYLFPGGNFFLVHQNEQRFMVSSQDGNRQKVLQSFVFHSMVMPRFEGVNRQLLPGRQIMLTQQSPPGSGTPWGKFAVALWLGLIVFGVWGLCVDKQNSRLKRALALTLTGQLALHLLYGPETFLYALHFGPLLIVTAVFGSFTRARRLVLALTVALTVCAGLNNGIQFKKVVQFYEHQLSLRAAVDQVNK